MAAEQQHGQLILLAALHEALARFGRPEIVNTDQGSQFTDATFTGMLMGRWMDNVFIERLWRSLKHEDIYLKGYADRRLHAFRETCEATRVR